MLCSIYNIANIQCRVLIYSILPSEQTLLAYDSSRKQSFYKQEPFENVDPILEYVFTLFIPADSALPPLFFFVCSDCYSSDWQSKEIFHVPNEILLLLPENRIEQNRTEWNRIEPCSL